MSEENDSINHSEKPKPWIVHNYADPRDHAMSSVCAIQLESEPMTDEFKQRIAESKKRMDAKLRSLGVIK